MIRSRLEDASIWMENDNCSAGAPFKLDTVHPSIFQKAAVQTWMVGKPETEIFFHNFRFAVTDEVDFPEVRRILTCGCRPAPRRRLLRVAAARRTSLVFGKNTYKPM